MIEVIVAPEKNRDELWELFQEYAQELSVYDGEKRPRTTRHYPCFDLYWQNETHIPFLVLYDHEPIGFCLLQQANVSYHIDEFYIRPLHRRRGFGTQSMECIKDYCRKRGRHQTLSANIYVNNETAIRFWQSLGFRDTGRRIRIKNLRMMETEADLT